MLAQSEFLGEAMDYMCEMHLHSSEISTCGKKTRKEMLDIAKKNGYDGVFFTDHFWRGNCRIKELSWRECIEKYSEEHKKAVEYGRRIGVDVFFGFELCERTADFLIYGIDADFLLSHPKARDMKIGEVLELFREAGGLVIQAHPFREARYIDEMLLYPLHVDGVEVLNTHNRTERADLLAEQYAAAYDMITTCGSDYHADRDHPFCAMTFSKRPESERDVIDMIRNREYGITQFFMAR